MRVGSRRDFRQATAPDEITSCRESWSEFGGFEPYVDESVVALFLDIEPRRVLELARAGQLPAHPIGRTRKTWRFRISEIDAQFSAPKKPVLVTMPVAVSGTKERNRLG
jgi:hypothetical protein